MMAGRDALAIPAWGGRRAQQALARVKAIGRRKKQPCWICRQRIDYSLEKPHPEACSVQHIKSRKHFPELTWDPSNWAPAHASCNSSAGSGDDATQQGVTSNDW